MNGSKLELSKEARLLGVYSVQQANLETIYYPNETTALLQCTVDKLWEKRGK